MVDLNFLLSLVALVLLIVFEAISGESHQAIASLEQLGLIIICFIGITSYLDRQKGRASKPTSLIQKSFFIICLAYLIYRSFLSFF